MKPTARTAWPGLLALCLGAFAGQALASDLVISNLAGTTFVGLKATVCVWGSVNTGTVSAASPAFSNLPGSYSVTAPGSFPTGSFFSFESASPGVTYANVTSLTSLITYGAAPTVGTQVGNGYDRNAAGETNGNFNSGLRSLGFTNQSVGVRIYGEVSPVPEPATWLMIALGVGALLLRQRRSA